MTVNTVLTVATILAVATWGTVLTYLLQIERRRADAQALLRELHATLERDDVKRLPAADRVARVKPILERSTRELLMYAAADASATPSTVDIVATYLNVRWPGQLEENAFGHRTARDRWRRITALRILHRLDQPTSLALLSRAIDQPDVAVAEAAFTLLSQSADPRAMDLLLGALTARRHPASRVASHIEGSPQRIAPRLRTLLTHVDPVARLWAATLLARYPNEPVEADLAPLTSDADPRVRKAALQTLALVGDELAAEQATRLLTDPVPYVRAHAARCLGELGRADLAEPVTKLLGDRDWWTRLAAREALEAMGSEVWPLVMRCLGHDDAFVRNGAAEVIQNIGVLDSLIVMEAASDNPGEAKIALLRRIAQAGGMHFTESLVDRAGPVVGARIRALLSTIGLERVEAR